MNKPKPKAIELVIEWMFEFGATTALTSGELASAGWWNPHNPPDKVDILCESNFLEIKHGRWGLNKLAILHFERYTP